jgi:hypothetical protein
VSFSPAFFSFSFLLFFQVLWRAMDRERAFQDTSRPTWKAIQTHWGNLMKARSVGVACVNFLEFFSQKKTTKKPPNKQTKNPPGHRQVRTRP